MGRATQTATTDADVQTRRAAKHERNREQRIEAVKRGVEYIESEPVETWEAPTERHRRRPTRRSPTGPALDRHQHVKTVAEEIRAAAGTDDEST